VTPILEIKDVHAYYAKAHVLHGMNLNIRAGERVALLGRNGVGKTTVVNSLLGVADVKGGSIDIHGRQLRTPINHYTAARSGISVVPQGRRILTNLTVEENLRLGAATRRDGKWNLQRIYELFPILGERANRSSAAMSGGQQQMLAIGRALMANPDLIILDEPSEGLAPIIIDNIGDVFVNIADQGTALLLIEQNLGLVQRVAKRVLVMSKGAIVEEILEPEISVERLHSHLAV